jgi:hypothetical protein
MSGSTSSPALLAPLPNRPSRSKASILRCPPLVNLGNPSPWITCRAFLLLSMDNDRVFVVVDRFSKMSIMMACKKNITTEANTKPFFERVWVHFGIPQSIISDQDNRFLSTFWSSFWLMLDTKLSIFVVSSVVLG